MKKLFLSFLMLAWASTALAAGTAVVSNDVVCDTWAKHSAGNKCIRVIKFAWTADAGKDVLAAENDSPATKVTGRILGVKNAPGTAAETFTFTIVDSENVMDVLQGCFVDVVAPFDDTADGNFRVPVTTNEGAPIYLVNETLSITVASAGSGETGTVYLMVELP